MPHDLVIKGGTIVDGTGADSFTGDIAIEGDRIVEVGRVGGRGKRTIDADGLAVTPGFVDIHTHLDAQLSWDPIGTSSCWHGITSVVLGNCGVTFAPCRPSDRAYLAELMESVEDIPAASILSGLSWEWETYGEYLGEIDRLPKGLNVGGMVGHCAVRHHAMGERGLDDRPASAEDIGAMTELVDEAMAAGALGFSTSRTLLHRVPDGRPVPGTWADTTELYAIADVLGNRERGVFEVAPRFEQPGADYAGTRAEVHWMAEVQRRSGRPVTFGVAQSDLGPELYQRIYECVDDEAAAGALLRPQTTARGIGLLFGLANRTFFGASPIWRDLQELDLAGRVGALEDASRRELLIEEGRRHKPVGIDFRGVYVMRGPDAHYDYTESDSLEHHAAVAGEDIVEAFVRISRETQGRALFSFPFLNQKMGAVEEMLAHPQTAIGLADSGAHVGLIMDAGLPTWLLSYWVRDRGRFTLEDGIRRMTTDTATLFGIEDRGVLQAGAFADINLIELDALALPLPEYVHDFPGGAGRYVQHGRGYEATIVNGDIFMERGEHTGSLTGVTLRSGPDER